MAALENFPFVVGDTYRITYRFFLDKKFKFEEKTHIGKLNSLPYTQMARYGTSKKLSEVDSYSQLSTMLESNKGTAPFREISVFCIELKDEDGKIETFYLNKMPPDNEKIISIEHVTSGGRKKIKSRKSRKSRKTIK